MIRHVWEKAAASCADAVAVATDDERIADAVFETIGIRDGETTDDGLFTLTHVACLGCCSLSPVMMINGSTYGSLTPAKVKEILTSLAKEAKEEA